MIHDMASWGWSSWLLFVSLATAIFALGFAFRDGIQQVRDKKPKKLEWSESFTLTVNGVPQCVARFVSSHRDLYGTTIEAVDVGRFTEDRKLH